MADEVLLTVSEAAKYAGVHRMTIMRWIRTGAIAYFQTVSHAPYQIRRSELDKMLSEKRKEEIE